MWVPIYVLINLYADQEVVRLMSNLFITETAHSPSVKTIGLIADQLELTLGYVGSLAPVVPAIAWGLISGTAYAVQHAIQAVGGGSAPAAAATAGATVMGMQNWSAGNNSAGSMNVGGSTVASSQMGLMVNEMNSSVANKTMSKIMNTTGGVDTYRASMATMGAINAAESLGTAKGKYDGSGDSLKGVHDLAASTTYGNKGDEQGALKGAGGAEGLYLAKAATAEGDMGGKIAAAQARARMTGESAEGALAGNVADQHMVTSSHNLGSRGALNDMGFDNFAEKTKLGEERAGYGEFAKKDLMSKAGADMSTPGGMAKAYRQMASAEGVSMPVTKDNARDINGAATAMGFSTRVQPGDTAKISGDGNKITSISATRGVDRQVIRSPGDLDRQVIQAR